MHLDFGKFLCLAPENSDIAIFSHYCFFNNFLLKSQNNVSLILELPLKSVDDTRKNYNSILVHDESS